MASEDIASGGADMAAKERTWLATGMASGGVDMECGPGGGGGHALWRWT
jgi:hypothetical protein